MTIHSTNGTCIDTVRLNLTIANGVVTDTTVTACQTFTWNRNGQTYSTSGTYDYTFNNGTCVDTVRLNLTIANAAVTDTSATACGSFTWDRNGLTYNTSGTYNYTFNNGACVDTVRLQCDYCQRCCYRYLSYGLWIVHLGSQWSNL